MKELDAYLKQDIPLVIHIGVITAITLMVYFVVNHAVNKFLDHRGSKDDFDTTNARFLLRVLNTLIFMVGLGFIIFVIPSLKHIAVTLLAGAGVIAAVIGFSSQQVLSNFISGIMIVLTKPYRIKDRVMVRDMEGVVEDITLQHTVIKNYENKRIIIPNSVRVISIGDFSIVLRAWTWASNPPNAFLMGCDLCESI